MRRRKRRFARIFLGACAVVLFLPYVAVVFLRWTVGGLYAACATGARGVDK